MATLVTEAAPGSAPSQTSSSPSAWLLVSLLVAALGGGLAAHANIDPDIYWHRVLGQAWLDGHSVRPDHDPIAYTEGIRDWFPTAWLSEVGYAVVVAELGYEGLRLLRLLLAVAFYALLAVYLHRRYPPWVAVGVLAIVGIPAALVLQDRPQTFSLVLCAASLPALHRWLFDDRLPSALVAIPLTWVWASLHGLWILVPAFFILAGAIRLIEGTFGWRPFVAGASCLIAAALTPVGYELLLSPFLVRSSTSEISEWQATTFTAPVAWGLAGALLVLVAAWSRSAKSVPIRHLAFALVIACFGLMAFRNAVVASLLLTPLVAAALASALPSVRTSATIPRPILVLAVLATVTWLAFTFSAQPPVPEELPARIAQRLRTPDTPLRVVGPYNLSGYLREFGGDGVRLAIDGRADRYGNARIRRYGDLMSARGDWEAQISRLRPDVVVVERTSPLRDFLLLDGWRQDIRDGNFVLLVRG